jgi:hypothetical protein
MNNPFDNVSNPFNQGTGGNPHANRRRGKQAEQTAEQYIRLQYGEPEPVPDHVGGRDFDVYDPMSGAKLYEIEVKSGNASLTGVQEERREKLRDGVVYIVLRFGNPPWY